MVHKVIPITKKGAECKKILSTRMMPKSIQKAEDDLNRAIELAQSLLDKRGKNISNSPTSDSVQNIPHRNRSDVENSNEISPLTPNFVKYSSSSSEQKMETVSSVGSKQIEKDEDYAAIARFIPGKSKKSSAPVPGLWAHPESHEVNISHNKHIDCEIPASFHEATAILKEFASLTLPPFWIVACTKGNIVDINISALFRVIDWSEKAAAIASTRRKYAVARRIKEPIQRSKVEICLPLTLNFSFNLSYEFLSNEKVSKTWILKPKALETCVANLIVPSDCKISVLRRIMKDEKGSSGGAEVIVLSSPIEGKNFYKCTRKFRAIRPQSKEKSITTSKTIKQPIENLSNELSDQKKDSYKSESFASVVLQNLRKERDASNRNNFPIDYHHRSDTLSLAARVLEEYIRNKKGDEIIRLHSEPPIIEEDDSRDSPCLSTTSELVPPCAVRVVKPDRSFPYITTPARNKCNSEEAIIKEPSLSLNDMLTVGKQNPSASNFHAFKSKLQHSQPKPFVFDKPKTLFEERVQNQANMLRKTSATSTISSFSEDETNRKETTPVYDITLKLPSPNRARHSSVENISSSSVPITCNFTAAAAAASIPRHERYAAHIPVNRAESTGRVSTNSIDSNASGQLDVAERQLDQMIDQARMRHYQHRSRFKEAIDYLDQIFEDLNKENDQAENSTQASRFPTTAKNKKLVDPHINNDFNSSSKPTVSTKAPQCAPSYISPNSRAQNGVHSTFHSSLPSKTKQREVKNLNGLESAVEVSETITVGRSKLKNERMDYTKKWLADDIKSWASVSSKPDLLLGGIEDDADSDERSVGSCSAEVAAINSLDRQKKFKNTPDLLKGLRISDKHARRNADRNLKQNAIKTSHTVPIKPQPLRPQPLNFSTSSTSLNSIFNNFPSSHRDIDKSNRNGNNTNGRECGTSLKRVSSHSQVIDKKYNHESSPWNSLSQDPFHAVGSIASDGSPFRTTAFAQYHPQRSFNEPIKEPSPVKTIRNDINPDPLLAMDALVAELDLNTDEMHPSGKRRSFPINVEAKKAKNLGLIKSPKKNSFPTKAPENPSDQKSKSKRECPNKSFDEMANMLHNVAGEINFTSSRKLEKNGNLQKSSQVMSPFDTINNEKINPSKVEALQSIFEKKIDAPSWRKKGRSNREEEHYHEISAFNLKESSSTKAKNVSLSPTRVNTMSRKIPTSQHDSIPAIPHIQASTVLAGSTNSSQTGGYYSSGSSLGAQSSCANSYNQSSLPRSPGRRGSYLGKHSHAASIDDEDDGFYDNLQIDERRFSRSSDMDNTSILSSRLPPNSKSSNRLGQFLRKIASSKPPENAASLVSLNKVPGETLMKQIPLMKSNSLSNEPWRKRVFNEKHPAHSGTLEKRTGFGQRLKNSIFGSKKRLA